MRATMRAEQLPRQRSWSLRNGKVVGTLGILLVLSLGLCWVQWGPSFRVKTGAQQHYQRGLDLLNQGLHAGAWAEFERSKSLGLDTADLYYHRACLTFMLAQDKLNDDGVRLELDRGLRLDPNHIPSLLFLAKLNEPAYRGKRGASEALRLYQRVLKLRPDRAELRLEVARWISGGTRFALASRELMPDQSPAEAVPVDSNWPLRIAQQQLEKVLQTCNPLEARVVGQAHIELGEILLRMGEYQ